VTGEGVKIGLKIELSTLWTAHLKNGVVTFYENCTNRYGRVDKVRGWYPPPGYLEYLKYNFLMAWAIVTIYTSKCAQMDPSSYLKRQNCIRDAKL